MNVAKWGDSLVIRLPAKLVEQMNLKEGDDVKLVAGQGQINIYTRIEREEALRRLFARCNENPIVPDDYVFDREEANAR